MKTTVLGVVGVWVLLAAMVFALVKLDTADEWAAWWIPCVVVGVAMVFFGLFNSKKRPRGR